VKNADMVFTQTTGSEWVLDLKWLQPHAGVCITHFLSPTALPPLPPSSSSLPPFPYPCTRPYHRAALGGCTRYGRDAIIEDLFVFNDTIYIGTQGAWRRRRIYSYSKILQRDPGRLRLSQGASLKPDESGGCSPVFGGRTIRLCSLWPSDDIPTPLRPPVDTGAGDRGGILRQVCSGGGDCRLSKGC